MNVSLLLFSDCHPDIVPNAEFKYSGPRDSQGLFHGGGRVTFSNGDEIMADFDHGIRNGDGVVISTRNNIARLCGKYVRGKLQGRGKVVSYFMKPERGDTIPST